MAACLKGTRLLSVGLMFHTAQSDTLQCFARDPVKSTVHGTVEQFEPFRQFVSVLRIFYQIEALDLISCNVAQNPTSNVIARLNYGGGVRVNASINVTGQSNAGRGRGARPMGDWVLEMGGVDLVGRYFNAKITKVDLQLQSDNDNDNIDYKELLDKIDQNKRFHPNNRACKYFDVEYFNTLKTVDKGRLLQIINSGIENKDSRIGCYAMAFDDYDKFMIPKRRFWKAEQTFGNAFSNHFSHT
jgi:hypothetical protein